MTRFNFTKDGRNLPPSHINSFNQVVRLIFDHRPKIDRTTRQCQYDLLQIHAASIKLDRAMVTNSAEISIQSTTRTGGKRDWHGGTSPMQA